MLSKKNILRYYFCNYPSRSYNCSPRSYNYTLRSYNYPLWSYNYPPRSYNYPLRSYWNYKLSSSYNVQPTTILETGKEKGILKHSLHIMAKGNEFC